MNRYWFLLLFVTNPLFAQNTDTSNRFIARVVDVQNKTPLPGATVQIKALQRGAAADSNGIVTLTGIPNGKFEVLVRFLGYEDVEKEYDFPLNSTDTLTIALSPEGEELGEVTVSTTRSSRTIGDIPTRIELISAGELDEKAGMQPGNIRMLLTESTGIQTQQTSAASANATIRIQGLDGKYTQLLQDGFPLYSGFASGLSILQIPPLNLKRVEVVKGSTSTLYGGGAIAGLINLIAKEPTDEPELSFLANYNQTQALDLSSFYAQKWEKTGVTVYASRNSQRAYDVNGDGLSDLPLYTRYTLNPRLVYYVNPATTVSLGLNSSFENRLGGDMRVIADGGDAGHTYFERNKTDRVSSQFRLDKTLANRAFLTIKNSVGYFTRALTQPSYGFDGRQWASFSEVSYTRPNPVLEWVVGANLWTDQFTQAKPAPLPLDYRLTTVGAFAQTNWKPNEKFVLETGLRTDYTSRGNLFVLPRVSALYKWSSHLTTRIGGGLGYKAPTPFSEEAEERGFQNIRPVNVAAIRNETSVGGNVDLNYRARLFDEVSLSFNQLFFYTRLDNPLVLDTQAGLDRTYSFYSANGSLNSKGFETNLKLTYDELAFYVGYTYIDAQTHYAGINRRNPFTSKSRIYSTLMYEIENKLRVGYELFYVGQQTIRNGDLKPGYWVMGISVERKWKHFSLFLNTENFTDVRQSRFEPAYTGTLQNPQFADIWAPTDGFVYNGGFKLFL